MILKIRDALDTINPDEDLITRTELLLSAKTQKRKSQAYRGLATAASLLLLMSTLPVAGYADYKHPVNYIDVDINPSLELAVNAFDRVVDVTYFNDDAEELISEEILSGSKPDEAVTLILQAASENGYIHEGETSVVSLAAYGSNEYKAEAMLQECTDAVASEYEDVAIYSTTVSNDLKAEADAASISTGKLSLIKMIQKLDDTAMVDDLKGDSVTAIVNQINTLTSDKNTGVSEENKRIVRNGISDVTAQIKQIEGKNQTSEKQTNDSHATKPSVQDDEAQSPVSPSPKQAEKGQVNTTQEVPAGEQQNSTQNTGSTVQQEKDKQKAAPQPNAPVSDSDTQNRQPPAK